MTFIFMYMFYHMIPLARPLNHAYAYDLKGGPWFLHGHILISWKWARGMELHKHLLRTLPILIVLPSMVWRKISTKMKHYISAEMYQILVGQNKIYS